MSLVAHMPARGPAPAPSPSAFKAAKRRESLAAFALAVPLLAFLLLTFVVPIGTLLWRSVAAPEVSAVMPGFAAAVTDWNGAGIPDERQFAALGRDILQASAAGNLAQAARRLNFYEAGFRSLLLKTARNLNGAAPAAWKQALIDIDARWGEHETWAHLRRGAASLTPDYLLSAVDHRMDADGRLASAPAGEGIFLAAFARTFWVSGLVTAICLALGYPVAYLLATAPPRTSSRLMIFVIVPFWTSLLVRTTAWYVLLQPNGLVNAVLTGVGLAAAPVPLVFNRTGVLIGMTHILLPYMILANYAVMKGIPPVYRRAALSLGAHPATAFLRVYLPQTLPGIGAGVFLVFVLALGYYITPALLGGGGDEMISQMIAFQTQTQLNWGMAGALSVYLVLFTLVFYFIFNRLIGVDRLRLG